jgi:hypothetical protein
MLFKWIIRQLIDQEENIQWNNIVDKLNEECLLSIERYDQMEKRLNDAKLFMQCIVYKKIVDKQKKDFKHSSTMCLINQWQMEKSTQTMNEKKIVVRNDSQLIDDIISKFIEMKERIYFSCCFLCR